MQSAANHICEYCLIAEEDSFFKFQVEHIISRKHGGSSEFHNLALACVFCNRHKGSDIASLIPKQDELVRFYDPRRDRWSDHFHLNGAVVEPLTEIGEATIRVLRMNDAERILERRILDRRRRYPSAAARSIITEH